jgi:uncharacterized protein
MPLEDFTADLPTGRQLIQGYRPGGFTIGGARHQGSVLVLPDRTIPWEVGAFDDLTLESLAPLGGHQPPVEILIVGSGARFAMVSAAFRAALRDQGMAVECMDTRAACRTFNVLLAEDRRVAAALIAL